MIINQIGRFGNAIWFLNYALFSNKKFIFNLYNSEIKDTFNKYFNNIYTTKICTQYVLQSFQNPKWLCDKNKILNFINEKECIKVENVIHIRAGDYLKLNNYKELLISNEQLEEQLKSIGIHKKDLICITDSPEYVKHKYGLRCMSGTDDLQDFWTMVYASNIIMSPSSFSYFGAYCSSAEKILFPRKWIYDIVNFNDKTSVSKGIDLKPNEKRYLMY